MRGTSICQAHCRPGPVRKIPKKDHISDVLTRAGDVGMMAKVPLKESGFEAQELVLAQFSKTTGLAILLTCHRQ